MRELYRKLYLIQERIISLCVPIFRDIWFFEFFYLKKNLKISRDLHPLFCPVDDSGKLFWKSPSLFSEAILNFYRSLRDYLFFYKAVFLKFFESWRQNTRIYIVGIICYVTIGLCPICNGCHYKKHPFFWNKCNKSIHRTHFWIEFIWHRIRYYKVSSINIV